MPFKLTQLPRLLRLKSAPRKELPIPLETIPDEVLEHVLSFCTKQDIVAILSTCQRLSCIATPFLYRSVKPVSSTKAVRFFQSISSHKYLGEVVRKCEVEISLHNDHQVLAFSDMDPFVGIEMMLSKHMRAPKVSKSIPTLISDNHVEYFLALFAVGLRRMPNLSHLDFFFSGKDYRTEYTANILDEVPFQLHHFHTNIRFDLSMANFFRTQKNLRDVCIQKCAPAARLDMSSLKDSILPHLESFGWSSQVPVELVRHLVKDRPIRTVNVHLPTQAYKSDLLAVGLQASLYITTAKFTFKEIRYPIYRQLEMANIQFPNLTDLAITATSLTSEIMKDIYKVVKYFKKLRGLFIYDQLHDTALTEQTIVEYATSFWTRCDTLRKIGFYIRDPFLMAEKRRTEAGGIETVLSVI